MDTSDQVSLSSSVSTLATIASTTASDDTIIESEYGLVDLPESKYQSATSGRTSTFNGSNASISAGTGSKESSFILPADIRKCGYMRKLKTNRRKFFVLRMNSITEKAHATISYYDTEKKFRANPDSSSQLPRRTTFIKHCWAVQRKFDKSNKHVMAIYTREDMLATVCEDERTLEEWLRAIWEVMGTVLALLAKPIYDFEHIWQVNITRSGLGLSRNITGLHRVCLAHHTLYVFRVDPSVDNPDIYEFPLNSIRKCGHNSANFLLELGRSSIIGPGELWMQTEDQALATFMHETILSTMSSGKKRSNKGDDTSGSPHIRTNSTGHRPRTASSASTDMAKSPVAVTCDPGSASVISRSNSNCSSLNTRSNLKLVNGKTAEQPVTPTENGHHHHHSANGHSHQTVHFAFHHGEHHSMHGGHHGHGHNAVHPQHNTCRGGSSTAASPAASRERLHSGSWSRTASECSNEDGSSGASSSNAAGTPVGTNNSTTATMLCDCLANISASNLHIWSGNSVCPCLMQHSNFSLDLHSTTNTSSAASSMDYLADTIFLSDHHDFHNSMPLTGGLLTLEPAISEEVDDFNSDDYYQMHPNGASEVNKSNSKESVSSMTSCKSASGGAHHGHQVVCVHLSHLQPTRSNSISASDRRHMSPMTIRCSCNGCQTHHSNGGFFTLPTVPAGSDADYLSMTPLSQQRNAQTTTTNLESSNVEADRRRAHFQETEEVTYLDMAPMSPSSKASTSSMSSAAATTSTEFHLEKVRSYYGDENSIATSTVPESAVPPQTVPPSACSLVMDESIFGLTRAYSLGQKPEPLAPSIAAQCTVPKAVPTPPQAKDSRARSNTTGSHELKNRAFRLKSCLMGKQPPTMKQTSSSGSVEGEGCSGSASSSSSLAEIEVNLAAGCANSPAKNSKASSAPILVQQRTRSATIGTRPVAIGQPGSNPMHHMAHCKLSHPHAMFIAHHHPNCREATGKGIVPSSTARSHEAESDLMEIDYSNKPRNMGNSDLVLSTFEEEIIREVKKGPSRSRTNSTSGPSGSQAVLAMLRSGGSTSLDGSTTCHHHPQQHHPPTSNVQPQGRKRSDSTSAISNFFGPPRPPSAHGPGGQQSSHKPGSTFENLIASFRQSLHIQPSSTSPLVKSTDSSPKVPSSTAASTEEESVYVMSSPSSSTAASKESTESLGQVSNANVKMLPPRPKPTPDPEEYTVMSPQLGLIFTSPKSAVPSERNNNNAPESMEMDLVKPARTPANLTRSNSRPEYEEEDSPYIMMAPDVASGRKSAPSSSSNSQKKQKISVRSLISSLGSRSNSESNQNGSSNSTRKKASTFSGRLLLNRSNSNNGNDGKRKKNSKSESSTANPVLVALPPTNCSADHVVATSGTVTTMSALAS